MLDTIASLIPPDPDYPARCARLALYKRVQDGTLYDALPYEFQDERTASGEYIPLRQRRPSVRYPLARIVVDDSISLVFGDGHFPQIDTDDPVLRTTLADIAAECRLNAAMQEAALRGAIGSVAILVRVLKGRVFLKVLETIYLTPRWQPARKLLDLLAMNVGAAKNAPAAPSSLPPAGGAVAALLLFGLGGCTASQVATTQARLATVNAAVCQADKSAPTVVALAAPVATAVDPAAAPAIAGAVQLDTTLIHPAIVAACAAVGAQPVAVTVAPVAVAK
jgi:hypothetical protein